MEKKITYEDCKAAYEKMINSWDHAEQHEFPMLFIMEHRLKWALNDLEKNWNEQHAAIFMDAMTKFTR